MDQKNLNRLIHEPTRLAIVTVLAGSDSLQFTDLRDLINTSDGNLSVHAGKLEKALYITCSKFFEGRISKTKYKLTAKGARALEDYFSQMETLIWRHRLRALIRSRLLGL